MFKQTEKNIIVAGHMGYAYLYPANTMLSFQKAIELGVDMLELDLNLSLDKELIVMHDNTIDRTTNGTGEIRNMTLKELKAYDAGIKKGEEFRNERIPTFTELLDMVTKENNIYLNVEIKEKTFETADLAIKALEKYNMLDKCVIACFDAKIVKYVNQKYGIKTQGFPDWYMSNFEEDTNSYLYSVGIEMKDLNKEFCGKFKSMGIDPWGYCPDTDEKVYQAIESGVKLITCNNPEPALRILREKGLHR